MMKELKEIQNTLGIINDHINIEANPQVVVEEMGEVLTVIQRFAQGASAETGAALTDRDKWQAKYYANLENRDDMANMITIEDHRDILTSCIRACMIDRD